MWIKVKRAYLVSGRRVEPGSTLEVNDAFGRELIASDKAERTEPEKPTGPMTTETTSVLVAGAGTGGDANTKTPDAEKTDSKTAAGKEKPNAGK